MRTRAFFQTAAASYFLLGFSWQRLLHSEGVVIGAIRQLDRGREFMKPTRLLGKINGLADMLYEGMP